MSTCNGFSFIFEVLAVALNLTRLIPIGLTVANIGRILFHKSVFKGAQSTYTKLENCGQPSLSFTEIGE